MYLIIETHGVQAPQYYAARGGKMPLSFSTIGDLAANMKRLNATQAWWVDFHKDNPKVSAGRATYRAVVVDQLPVTTNLEVSPTHSVRPLDPIDKQRLAKLNS